MAETAANIIKVVKKAYDTALEVKANKRRCRRLGERLRAHIGPLEKLKKDPRAKDEKIALEQTLEKFHKAKWYERTVGAALGPHKGDFEDINESVSGRASRRSSFGIITETMFAVRDDRDDEQKDLFESHATLEAMLAVQGRQPQDVAATEDELSAVDARLQQLGENISEQLFRLGADAAEESRADIIAAVKEGHADIKEGQADMIARLEAIEANSKRFRGRRRGVEARDARSHFRKRALEELKKEAIVHQSLSHPNILAFYGFCPEDMPPTPALVVLAYVSDILGGLTYLHNLGVFHRDLKSMNILVCVGGVVELADFGLAKVREATSASSTAATSRTGSSLGKGPGTCNQWMAPELLDGSKNPRWRRKADVYGLGVACNELRTCSPPWARKRDAEIIAARAANPDVVELLEQFWAHDPNARPALADGWVQRRVASALEALGGDPRKFDAVLGACSPESRADAPTDSGVRGDVFRELGAIPLLVELGMSGSDRAKQNVACALSQLAHNDENKIAIAKAGAIPVLAKLAEDGHDVAKTRAAAAALWSLAIQNSENQIAITKAGAIPVLAKLAEHGSDVAKTRAAAGVVESRHPELRKPTKSRSNGHGVSKHSRK
ncbi:hypothetical protein CTAYLR_004195 [Chrysophaeum taylorii]|uniref:Protein kinase domain-containing protein n=1 Tax=Chrysophaeum taylorii TaxID=2483200 RepID=A0AAD7XNM6_9STRA|nr:hypothetical protein CTAYLR_004195 [Chrysophaeum taylorii]